jgi:ABC-type phosphate/phosphonate transport system ATPase subunit
MPIVQFENVTRTYASGEHELKALDKVSFSLDEGKFVVILGPSGAGKSTLLNLLGGLDSPTEGKITVNGRDISTLSDNQLAELSAIILTNYYWLNLAEVMQFIAKFKLGIFGQFYGTVDPLKITSALQLFIRHREESIDYHERNQKRIQDEQRWRQRKDGAVTYEEYLKIKSLAQQGDTNAQKQIYGIQHP